MGTAFSAELMRTAFLDGLMRTAFSAEWNEDGFFR
jgi:hypothetical protein